jgi:hypothetical protein
MITKHIETYARLMKEVKRRVEVVKDLHRGLGNAEYEPAQIESVYLQFRKMLELVALGSLVANRDALDRVLSSLGQHWNAKRMFKDIKKVNPDFYPRAVVEPPSRLPGVTADLLPRTEGVLTKQEFILLYDRCGAVLHASNPLGRAVDYDTYRSQSPQWLGKIMSLLESHTIHLVGDDGFWLIHMQEDGDDEVHFYRFDLVGPAVAGG